MDWITDFLYVALLLLCGAAMWGFIALCSRLERREGASK